MMIMILDDHPLARQGLESILKSYHPDTEIVQVGSIHEAMDTIRCGGIDMAFVDLYLGNESGFDFIEMVREENQNIKIFMITSSSKKQDFLKAKELGVDAYVLKDAFVEEIVYGMRVVEKGGKFFSQAILESINHVSEEERLLESLTDRELEILTLLGEGYTNAMIGEELVISEGTVKKHISNILGKLSLTNRVNAVIFASKHNIITKRYSA